MPGEEGLDNTNRDVHQSLARGQRGPCDVRCDDAVAGRKQRVFRCWRFLGEDIKSRPGNAAGVERRGQRRFIHQRDRARC